mmetsp:Transcript_61366/g.115547  ORF Transcript_61366/g.115547 Transcript_61366/m.115547 type:complete len:111 (+) Transcript_61366:1046-1378(+)
MAAPVRWIAYDVWPFANQNRETSSETQRPAVIKKSERHGAAEQRVREVSAKTTTPDAPSGHPFAGPSALCAAAELNVTQSMILNIFMEPNSLSEVDPTKSKLKLKCCPFH